ncbi:hypothetical protein BC940DRAFT_363424 [Gongronella butleri]|nr:hypothetical protein BC940DRAFT_363424 [Gongronella butleri]
MSDTGQTQLNADSSVSTFVSALWFNAALGAAFFGTFTVLRRVRPQTYSPRTYAVPVAKRPPPLANSYLGWIWQVLKVPADVQIRTMGLDRYMVLRFLRLALVVFVSFSVIGIPIMMPLNIVGQLDSPGLNVMTIGNVRDANRLWAHLVLSVLLTAGLIYYTFRETHHYLGLRRQYLMSDEYKQSVMARTVFIPSIPQDANSVEKLKTIFDKFSGGVKYIWLNRDLQDLPDKVNERQQNVVGLEATITKVILASYKKNVDLSKIEQSEMEQGHALAALPVKMRPTHRVKPKFMPFGLPCVGKKVDSIDYYNEEIARLNKDIQTHQQNIDDFKQRNSAFIEFHYQSAAQMAAQTLVHHIPLQMAPRQINVMPSDIIWENMNINSYERLGRRIISLTITTAIVILWAIPVVFVQSISSLESLSKILPFLMPVLSWPPTVVGIIQGILPAVLLAILMALVPIVLTLLSTFEGIPQKSFVDLSVLHKYFFFQFVNVVLVSTIAAGILQTLPQLLMDPTSIINVLAENLPKASTFFITYVMLQATNGSGQAILQLVPFLLSYVLPMFNTTPRDIYMRKTTLARVGLGTLIPAHSVVFVLGIEYSTIAPLILPFVILYFGLNYFVYLYQFLYVYELDYETGGRAFPRAIRHIYVGMFTWQLTMVGLYAVRGHQALGQLIITVLLIVFTAFALALYDNSFKPLFKFLPMDSFDPVEMDIGLNKDKVSPSPSTDKKLMDVKHIEDDKRALNQHHDDDSASSSEHVDVVAPLSTAAAGADELASSTPPLSASPATQAMLRQRKLDKSSSSSPVVPGTPCSMTPAEKDAAIDAVQYSQQLRRQLISKTAHLSLEQHDELIASDASLARETRRLNDSQAYMHPATYAMQPAVWLPQDELGITETELKLLRDARVLATSEHATAFRTKENKGKVDINEQALITEGRGIPGSLPNAGEQLSSVQTYVLTVVNNLNFFSAMGGTNFLATGP